MTTIKIEGLDKALKKVEKVGNLDVVKAGIKEAGNHVKGKAKIYPPRTYVAQPFVSEKQKRWFFAALASGEITVPYRRTRGLGDRWALKMRNKGLTAVVGNILGESYGQFVMGDKQAWFMKERDWKTTEKIAQEETETVRRIVAKAVNDALGRL